MEFPEGVGDQAKYPSVGEVFFFFFNNAMLEEHSENLEITGLQLMIYEFFLCSPNIPHGLSAYKP